MTTRFIPMASVIDRVSLSKTEIYRKINNGTFPRPVPLGDARIAFIESEIEEWMAGRLAAREAREGVNERRLVAKNAVAQRRR